MSSDTKQNFWQAPYQLSIEPNELRISILGYTVEVTASLAGNCVSTAVCLEAVKRPRGGAALVELVTGAVYYQGSQYDVTPYPDSGRNPVGSNVRELQVSYEGNTVTA